MRDAQSRYELTKYWKKEGGEPNERSAVKP